MTARQFRNRIGYLLDYEPTWFPEFGSGLGIMLWGMICCFTSEFHVHGTDMILPGVTVLFGPARWVLLVRLNFGPRVLASIASALTLAWIGCGAIFHIGLPPMIGFLVGLWVMDLLTIARFSRPCLADLVAEFRGRHASR